MQSLKDYTRSIRLKENAYYLNKKGAALVGAKKQFRVNDEMDHKLMRNDAYIYFKPSEWWNEQEISVGDITVIPDAFFYSGSTYKFLEADNTQKWNVNVKKMKQYKKLKDTRAFQRRDGRFPVLVWVVKFEVRKRKLQELAKEIGLHCDVYLHDEIKNIQRSGQIGI